MIDEKDASEDDATADAVTPGDEPSALERGARIFERLRQRRRPNPDEPASR